MKSAKHQTILLPLKSWPYKSLLTLLGAFLAAFVTLYGFINSDRALEDSTSLAWCLSSR